MPLNLQKNHVLTEKGKLIELLYDEELVHPAEQLYESGAVYDVSKLEANLYIATVRDGKHYEVEIQSPFAKKLKCSCECKFFEQNKICRHVIAVLFDLRKNQNEAKDTDAKTRKKITQPKPVSLNITHILDVIHHDELMAFVKNYARQDKKFATQLKVNFARKIDLADNVDKYRNILNSLIKPHAGQSTRASASEIKAVAQVLEEFADQINDCIALRQFREAFDILNSAFAKLEYIRHHYSVHSDLLAGLGSRYHQIASGLLNENLPPELRAEVRDYFMDLATRSYYHFRHIDQNILAILGQEFKPAERIRLLETAEHLATIRSGDEKALLLAIYIRLSGKYGKNETGLIRKWSVSLVKVCDFLLEGREEKLALRILEQSFDTRSYDKEIAARLVYLYVRLRHHEKLKEMAVTAYINSADIKYMDILKREVTSEEFADVTGQLREKLISEKADPNLLIRLYRKEEDWSGLMDYLLALGSIEILMQYDSLLYKYQRSRLINAYTDLITIYLEEHVGEKTYEYLARIKQHIGHQQMEALERRIREILHEKFSHRPVLLENFD